MSYFGYTYVIDGTIIAAQARTLTNSSANNDADQSKYEKLVRSAPPIALTLKRQNVLDRDDIPVESSGILSMLYLGIFGFAELAFVVMATREYLQTRLGITDAAIVISRTLTPSSDHPDVQFMEWLTLDPSITASSTHPARRPAP